MENALPGRSGIVQRSFPLLALAVAAELLLASAARAGPGAVETPHDLRLVRGIEHFPQDPALRALLERDGFAVVPRTHRQIFSPYLLQIGAARK